MNSVAEHLKKLQHQYLPFLHQTLERLAKLKDNTEYGKVKVFVELLSSDVQTIQGLDSELFLCKIETNELILFFEIGCIQILYSGVRVFASHYTQNLER
jgi:hypothetical protein